MDKEYKILCYGNIIVEEKFLHKGFYESKYPILHDKNEKLEDIISRIENIIGLVNNKRDEQIKSHIKNLKKCELRSVKVTFKSI